MKKLGAHLIKQDKYFEESTLYALACVLAYKRILLLDGIYSQIEQIKPDLGTFLKERLDDIDSTLEGLKSVSLYRYHRLALAETVIQRVENRLSACTYLEFKKQYEDSSSGIEEALKPTKEFLFYLNKPDIGYFMYDLKKTAIKIGDETGISSSLVEDERSSS